MSDFSGLEQSFVLPAMPVSDAPLARQRPGAPLGRPRSFDVRLADVEFRRLQAADEIHAIQKMRSEIQLPGAAVADAGFIAREKKRTGKGSSALSSGMTRS